MNFYDPDKAVFCSKPASIQNSIDIASDNWVTFFQKLGVLNDGFADLYPDFRINWLNKQFDNLTGKSVLELGSLEGAHTLQYEELGCSDVIGIESNEAHFMKSLLIKNAAASSNIQFLLGDFSSYLKNCKRRFDLISACGVLYHMINPMEIIGSCSMISDTIFIWTVIYNKKWICNHGVKAMSKNKVQFQAGYSLIQLFQDYGTESQCREALFKLRWPTGFNCPECGGYQYCFLKARKLYQCNQCHHQTSLISRTIFEQTKLPLTKWFLAIYLITQSKTGLSALALKREIGVSYKTAWSMKHKIMQVMKERDDCKRLSGTIQLDDVYWAMSLT